MRCVNGFLQVLAGAGAGIDGSSAEQALEGVVVQVETIRLAEFGVPGYAQPSQVFADGFEVMVFAALWVEVVDAEKQVAVCRVGSVVGVEERGCVAEVQQACW